MAKNKLDLQMPAVEPTDTKAKDASSSQKGNGKKGNTKKGGKRVSKFFRDTFSELKKVTWAKFRSTKNEKGVLSQLGTVLVIVAVFIVLITAIDLGLSELLGLLIGSV